MVDGGDNLGKDSRQRNPVSLPLEHREFETLPGVVQGRAHLGQDGGGAGRG